MIFLYYIFWRFPQICAHMLLYRSMPDVELLMQEWPNQFEQLLATVNLPSSSLDCTLSEYVDIICGETIGHVMSPWHNNIVH